MNDLLFAMLNSNGQRDTELGCEPTPRTFVEPIPDAEDDMGEGEYRDQQLSLGITRRQGRRRKAA